MSAAERLVWSPAAWEDYVYWQGQDRKQLRRINQLIQACMRDPWASPVFVDSCLRSLLINNTAF